MGIFRLFVCLFLLLLSSASFADTNNEIQDQIDGFPLDATLNADVDSDGLPDDYEDYYELDKYNFTDAVSDSDNDGLTATEEFLLGTFPNNNDSDSDTLLDHWELETNLDPLVPDYQIGLGMYFSCALADLGIECWGTNALGQIDVPDLNNPTQITVGNYASCAIDNTEPVCWGHNMQGQINLPELTNPTQISIGGYHSCAIDHSEVICWGQSIYGKTNVPALSNPTQISAGDQHTCAIDDSGVVCWGNNEYALIDVPSITNPTHISSGLHHACAIDDSGVVCWGDNSYNQTTVPELINPMQISLGNYHSCVIDDTGVVCWGSNDENQINVPELINPKQISLGGIHSCALDDTGVVCWGSNDHGQIEVPNLVFDIDGDNVNNYIDKFPLDTNEAIDFDNDGIGDNADSDDDNDGVSDDQDLYPLDDRYALDTDSDGIPDNWEMLYGLDPNDRTDSASDQDGDGAVALQEFIEGTLPVADADNDGLSDNYEVSIGTDPNNADSDDDGVNDKDDMFPLNSAETIDTDLDGIGNNSDLDDDNDGLNDDLELHHGLDPLVANSVNQDFCNLPDDNLIAWWDGEGTTTDRVSGLVGNPLRGWTDNYYINYDPIESIGFAEGKFGDAFSFSGDGDHLDFGPIQAFQPPNIDSITLSAWVYRKGPSSFHREANSHIIAGRAGLRGDGTSTHGGEYLVLTDDVAAFALNDSTGADIAVHAEGLMDNQWHHLVGIFDANTKVISIYANGLLIEAKTANGYIPSNNTTWKIGASSHWSSLQAHNGYIDELQVFNKALTSNEVLSLTAGCYYLDNDNDSVLDYLDAFPDNANEHIDTDLDGIGDNADLDDDNDGFADTYEIANNLDPLVANLDIDNDGIANELDADNDNDGIKDDHDAYPIDSTEHLDTDSDGMGNNTDVDDDGDGVSDIMDTFPLDAFESADSDGDGVGDNADFFPNSAEYSLDSDLDQMPDAWERKYGLNPTDASDAAMDQDNDGYTALEEYEAGTIPLKILDIDANGSIDALTDGLIILRYIFRLRGDALVNNALAADAMRTDVADIEAYVDSLMPDF